MADIRPATFIDLAYVAINMRDWDRREIFATLRVTQPVDFAELTMRVSDLAWIVYRDNEPVIAFGAGEMWSGVWNVWAFGTDKFPKAGLSATRFMRKVIPEIMDERSIHRIECKSMEGHTEAHKWLNALGLYRESEHPGFGKNRETFYTYARLQRAEKSMREAA